MPQHASDLHLHEQVLLLALRDKDGTIEIRADRYPQALGGAILAELVLHGRLTVSEDDARTVGVADHSPLRDPVLDEAFTILLNDGETRPASQWIDRFSSIDELKHKVARELCDRGILKDSLEKVLLLFSRKVYPELDHQPEQELIDLLRAAIFSERTGLAPRSALLVSLSHFAGILDVHFESGDLKRRAERIAATREAALLQGMNSEELAVAVMAQRAIDAMAGVR